MNEYNSDLCGERHVEIGKAFKRMENNIDNLYSRLNWFYLIAIATLAAVIGQYFK